jgi:hypothetical protein
MSLPKPDTRQRTNEYFLCPAYVKMVQVTAPSAARWRAYAYYPKANAMGAVRNPVPFNNPNFTPFGWGNQPGSEMKLSSLNARVSPSRGPALMDFDLQWCKALGYQPGPNEDDAAGNGTLSHGNTRQHLYFDWHVETRPAGAVTNLSL